jgi:hypothetical protein
MTHFDGILLLVALWHWREKCTARYHMDIVQQKNQEARHKHYYLFDLEEHWQ